MNLKPILLFALILHFQGIAAQVRVLYPRIENLDNPIGLDVTQPRFGWQLAAERRNVLQTAYEIQVAASQAELSAGKNYNGSRKIQSDVSVWVNPRRPGFAVGRYLLVAGAGMDNAGNVSDWTTPAYWQMGLFQAPPTGKRSG